MTHRLALIVLTLTFITAGCQKKGSCCDNSPKTEMNATPQASLLDTHWELSVLRGAASVATEPGRMAFLTLSSKDNRAGGMASVNRFGGKYTLDGSKLTFSQIASTRMAGPEPLMKQEHAFEQALQATNAWRLTGNTLELLEGDSVLLTFTAR
jgi:heat shock protein HslJ